MTDVKELNPSDSDMAQLFYAINKIAANVEDMESKLQACQTSLMNANERLSKLEVRTHKAEMAQSGLTARVDAVVSKADHTANRIAELLPAHEILRDHTNKRVDKLARHVESMEQRLLTHQGLLCKLTVPTVITSPPETAPLPLSLNADVADARRYRMLQALDFPQAVRIMQYKKTDADRMLDKIIEEKRGNANTCDEGQHVWVRQRSTAFGAEYRCDNCLSIRTLGANF